MRRFLLRPVDQVSRQLESLAGGGGISATRLSLDSDDALGRLVLQFNALIDRLQGTLRRVIETVEAFAAHAEETGKSAHEFIANVDRKSQVIDGTASLFAGMRQELLKIEAVLGQLKESAAESRTAVGTQVLQIAAVNEQIAQLQERSEANAAATDRSSVALQRTSGATQDSTRALDASSASMTEMDFTVREIDRNLKESTTLAERVATDATAGDLAVASTRAGMERIRSGVAEAAATISELGRRVGEIATVTGVIDEDRAPACSRSMPRSLPRKPASTAGASRSSPTRSRTSPAARRAPPARSPGSWAPFANRRTPPSLRWSRAGFRSRKG